MSTTEGVSTTLVNPFLQSPGVTLPLPNTAGLDFQSGQIFQATVRANPKQSNVQEPRLGLELNGKFIPLELPPSMEVGDRATVQVLKLGDKVFLKILAQPSEKGAPDSSSVELEKLLRILKLSEEQSRALREFVAKTPSQQKNTSWSEGSTKEYLARAALELEELGLLSEGQLSSPEKLSTVLSSGPRALDLQKLGQLRKQIENGAVSESAQFTRFRNEVLFEIIEARIGSLLTSDAQKRLPGNDPALKLALAQGGQAQGLAVLLESLTRIGLSGELTSEAGEVVELIRAQLSQTLPEQRFRDLLDNTRMTGGLPVLVNLLSGIDTSKVESSTGFEREFLKWVIELRGKLELQIKNQASSVEIKETLEQALLTLDQRFLGIPTELDSAAFSKKYLSILRAVDGQLRITLDLLNAQDISGALTGDRFKGLLLFLEQQETLLRDLKLPKSDAAAAVIRELREGLIKIKENGAELSEVRNFLQLSRGKLAALTIGSRESAEFEATQKNRTGSTNPSESPGASQTFRQIEALIRQVVAELDLSMTSAGTLPKELLPGPRSVRQNPDFNSLLELLKKIDFSKVEKSSDFDRNFFEFLGNFKSELESASKKSDESSKAVLKRALDTLRSLPRDSSKTEQPISRDLREALGTLKNLETFARGQEVLSQLNPVLQSLGEPIMLLFPSIIHGLFSRVELLGYAATSNFNSSSGGESSAKDNFERLEFSVRFPILGQVRVDLAHRSGELLMNLILDQPDLADEDRQSLVAFVERNLPTLRHSVAKLGYTKTEFSVRSGRASPPRPEWLSKLAQVKIEG